MLSEPKRDNFFGSPSVAKVTASIALDATFSRAKLSILNSRKPQPLTKSDAVVDQTWTGVS
jgi:hypothetical protein